MQGKQSNACRLRCQRDDKSFIWEGNQKKEQKKMLFSRNLLGNYQFLLFFFSCQKDKDIFSWRLTGIGHWHAAISYLEVLQANESVKEYSLEINRLRCPNLHQDLILMWATSEGNNCLCQTPKHTLVSELFMFGRKRETLDELTVAEEILVPCCGLNRNIFEFSSSARTVWLLSMSRVKVDQHS